MDREREMIQALIPAVSGILDKFVEDKDTKAKLAHDLATMAERHAQELAKGQIAVNAEEAKSKNIFIAGWRPFVGWTCGLALFVHFLAIPICDVVTAYLGYPAPSYPAFDMDTLMTVLLGMLGLGGLRTYEKQKGLTK
jgi:phenylpyruvate tautomerase PptA (4-oxalocrotonate tautomerase family)